MNINSKEDKEFIPGTLNIYATELTEDVEHSIYSNNIKTKGKIILIPQPSDSPNDPLNWKRIRKLTNFVILAFITGFTAATSNDAGATQDSLNELYGISYDSMNTGAGVLFIGIASGAFFLTPLASLYGRKISYFICIFLGMLGAIWFALARTTSDTIWSQLFVGISESCAEAQVQLSLSDLYFQHQLGSVLTIYILATSVGTFLGPLIAGFITQYCGFRWVGWIAVFISIGLLIAIVFIMEETYFDRSLFQGIINSSSSIDSTRNLMVNDNVGTDKKEKDDNNSNNQVSEKDVSSVNCVEILNTGKDDPPKTYWQRIKLITQATNLKGTGFKQYLALLKMLLRVFLFPPVIFSGLVWGMQDALLTFYLTVEDDVYYDPPYSYSNTGVALINIPTLIGAIIGCFYAGTFSDWFTIWLAKRNNGVQESEYRLWFLFVPAVLAPIGLVIFAVGTDQHWSWFPTYFGLVLVGLGFGASGDVSMSYLMDSYPEMVIEMMCGVAVINNLIGCIFTFACSPWLARMGNTNTFIILAVLEFLIMMGAAPMIYFGKRIRAWTKDWYLEYCLLRDGV